MSGLSACLACLAVSLVIQACLVCLASLILLNSGYSSKPRFPNWRRRRRKCVRLSLVIPVGNGRGKKTVIVLGDMNIDLKKHPQNKFTKALTQMGFQQLVKCSTHILGGLLDHVYAFCPDSSNCTLYKTHPLYFSDHDAVTFFLQLGED